MQESLDVDMRSIIERSGSKSKSDVVKVRVENS